MKERLFSVGALALSALVASCSTADTEEHGADEPVTLIEDGLSVEALQPGAPRSGLGGSKGSEQQFSLLVPVGATGLHFNLSGGVGDADLYVRFGASPTSATWDYRPYLNGNNESVTPSPIKTGTWYVMVRGYRDYSGATLTASFTLPNGVDAGAPTDAGSPGDAGPAPDAGPTPDAGPAGLNCHDPATWPASWTSFEDQTLVLLNARRAAGATCGTVQKPPVGPLVMDPKLREAARCHSLDMGSNAYFDHTSQDGRSPWDRIAQAGYTASPTAENIAAGYATPAAVVAGWMASTGHCNNIMGGGSNETGVGYASVPGSPYGNYWTQDFGHR